VALDCEPPVRSELSSSVDCLLDGFKMMTYSPFDKPIHDLLGKDLDKLRNIPEGWHVEYKSQTVTVKDFAKSLSAFANQYGGWLFVGIEEAADGTRVAGVFPGIPSPEVPAVETALRNASKDCVHPNVFYEHTVLAGPVPEVDLPSGHAVIVVAVPMGVDTPYVHSDGRIYRRVSDSSAPVPEKDKHVLDALWRRGETSHKRLRKLATHVPTVSKGESKNPFLHLFISDDPLEQSGKRHPSDWKVAMKVMKGDPIPFDNIYPRSGGFVARQAKANAHNLRLFTWEFYREGHSFITVPMAFFDFQGRPAALKHWLSGYEQADSFLSVLADAGVTTGRILDLNFLLFIVGGTVVRHRSLLREDGVVGPFYAKVQLENVWRCIPFLDLPSFVDQLKEDGVPIVQESVVLCPPGDDLESFQVLAPADAESSSTLELFASDGVILSIDIFLALGVSPTTLADGAMKMGFTADRAKAAQLHRNNPRRLTNG